MKTVLITEANKGIGFETAKALASLGYCIYLGSRKFLNDTVALKKLNELRLSNVECIEINIINIDSILLVKQTIESKTPQLDVLINKAGVTSSQSQNISTGKIETLRNVFETNFLGTTPITQQFIDLLKKSDQPKIINVSSPFGSFSFQSDS